MKEEDKIEYNIGYNSKGKKYYEFPKLNGKLHGLGMYWYENGQKQAEVPWVNGQKHGISTWWNEDGSLWYVEKWNQGQLVVGFGFNKSDVPEGEVPKVNILTKEFKLL
jgi:antitoxin component YwqK of YwqJK toxin-antitoxin module